MHRHRTLTSIVLVIPLCLPSSAQPPMKHGCHYHHEVPGRKPVWTPELKAQIDETIARSDTFDILHYDITLDVTDYAGQQITAATAISFTPLMPGQSFIRFDLVDLTVDSVTDVNGTLSFEQSGDFLKVFFASSPPVGSTNDLTVHYHGHPYRDPVWGGVYFESNMVYSLGIGLSTIPPNFGKVLYPCFDSFVERATYAWHVTSAGGRKFHGQGDLVGEVVLGGDTVRRDFLMNDAIPTHVSAFAVSNYVDSNWVHIGAYGPVNIRLTAQGSGINTMVNKFADLDGAIDAMEFWFGPQPYDRVGYVQTTDGAMEHPTNIAYPLFMNGQNNQANQNLYSHELGHHWWGDMVTPHVHNHMWLKEGPAEYASHLAEEWIDGHDAFIDMVKDNHLNVLRNAHIYDGGFWPMSPMPDAHIYGDHTYYKGASVMHNLRGYLGDTLFRQAMTGVQGLLAETDMTPEQFRDALESAGGVDLDAFFNDQVFKPGFSVWVVNDVRPAGIPGSYEVDLRQRLRACPDWYTDVPLDITFIGADGATQEHLITAGGELPATLVLPCAFTPAMTVIDRHNRLNMARMDFEQTIVPGVSYNPQLPYVDFRADDISVPDTALLRVEHIWAGPDADDLGWGIDAISSTHYWIVDGLWPAGLKLNGRILYDGATATDLDNDLYGVTEADARLVYRATPQDPWEVYPYTTIVSGGLSDGGGQMKMDTLLRGQYAFANGTAIAQVPDPAAAGDHLPVYPTPADDRITVVLEADGVVLVDLIAGDGRLVQRTQTRSNGRSLHSVDVSSLAAGSYFVRVSAVDGSVLGTAKAEVR